MHERFLEEAIDHAFCRSWDGRDPKKDMFAPEEAERINWIGFTIEVGGRVEYFEWIDDGKVRPQKLVLVEIGEQLERTPARVNDGLGESGLGNR